MLLGEDQRAKVTVFPFARMTHTDVTYDQTKEEQKLTLRSQEGEGGSAA